MPEKWLLIYINWRKFLDTWSNSEPTEMRRGPFARQRPGRIVRVISPRVRPLVWTPRNCSRCRVGRRGKARERPADDAAARTPVLLRVLRRRRAPREPGAAAAEGRPRKRAAYLFTGRRGPRTTRAYPLAAGRWWSSSFPQISCSGSASTAAAGPPGSPLSRPTPPSAPSMLSSRPPRRSPSLGPPSRPPLQLPSPSGAALAAARPFCK